MLKDIFEKGQGQQPGAVPAAPGIRPVRPPTVPQASLEPDVGALTALTEESVVVGKIKLAELITTRYTLDQVNQGYEDMMAGRNIRGVIIHD